MRKVEQQKVDVGKRKGKQCWGTEEWVERLRSCKICGEQPIFLEAAEFDQLKCFAVTKNIKYFSPTR